MIEKEMQHRSFEERIRALEKSEAKYRDLVDRSLTGIIIVTNKQILFANRTVERITGYSQDEIAIMDPIGLVHPEDRESIRRRQAARLRKRPARETYETRWVRRNGRSIWVEVRATIIESQGEQAVLVNVVDITERVVAEKALQKREEELARQARKLEETNHALKVLLEQRDKDRVEMEENIQANIRNLVQPTLFQLKEESLGPEAGSLVEILETNLDEVTSPFTRNLSERSANFTPKELRVADLIKQGLSSKEIGRLLGITPGAVDFHRNNIRRKMGLVNSKKNLRSYLLSLR